MGKGLYGGNKGLYGGNKGLYGGTRGLAYTGGLSPTPTPTPGDASLDFSEASNSMYVPLVLRNL